MKSYVAVSSLICTVIVLGIAVNLHAYVERLVAVLP